MNNALIALVWERARDCCEYCQLPQALDELRFEIDHIIAEQHGGPTVAANLALACFADNPELSRDRPQNGPTNMAFQPSTAQVEPAFSLGRADLGWSHGRGSGDDCRTGNQPAVPCPASFTTHGRRRVPADRGRRSVASALSASPLPLRASPPIIDTIPCPDLPKDRRCPSWRRRPPPSPP